MKILLLTAALLISSLVLFSCKKDNPLPPGEQPQISLTLEDTSCTEAWIKLTTANISLPAEVILMQDDSVTQVISLNSSDTLLYVDTLLPNHTYNFHTTIQTYNISSNVVNVTTMDTTSHNFTFQTWTFGGEAGSCTLYDVAIIDENNIWAVGEIYLLDSTGVPDPNAYNAVHWDGNQWELKRIRTNACGGVVYPPIQAIFAFSADDILFAHIDGSITHYDGIAFRNDCSLITQLNGSANKIWGTSRYDYYAVSGNGFIAHYQNGQWSRIESGTTTTIQDIWGSENLILCAVSNVASPGDRKILEVTSNQVTDFLWNTDRRVHSIWFKNKYAIYTSGGGVFSLKDGIHWNEITEIPLYYSESIRGENYNNIWVTGDFGLLAHYNGFTWKVFNGPAADIYYACAVKGNTTIFVGTKGGKAIVSQAYN